MKSANWHLDGGIPSLQNCENFLLFKSGVPNPRLLTGTGLQLLGTNGTAGDEQ